MPINNHKDHIKKNKEVKAMTKREIIDIIKESPLWNFLSIGERKDALAYAVKSVNRMSLQEDKTDISDTVGEVFRA